MIKGTLAIIIFICVFGCLSCIPSLGSPQEIYASELFDQIGKGKDIVYSNVIIHGDLNLSDLDSQIDESQNEIDSSIRITGSIFKGNLVLDNKVFRKALILNNDIFNGSVSFSSSRFSDITSFNGSVFNSSAVFSEANFLKEVGLKGCIFKDGCDFAASFEKAALFKDVMFSGDANFGGAVFKDDFAFNNATGKNSSICFFQSSFYNRATFAGSRFEGNGFLCGEASFAGPMSLLGSSFKNLDLTDSNFAGTVKIFNGIFNGSTSFTNTTFNKETRIYDSVFNGDLDLNSSKFRQQASFKASIFNGSAFFEKSEFERRAQFGEAIFSGLADFTDCIFKEDALFEGAELKGDLVLKRTEYKKMFVRWENINNLQFDDSSFLLLIENFKKIGFWSDADQCYYAYRSERNRHLPLIYRPVDWMLSILYGYGTKPERPVLWFFLTIVIFGLVFYSIGGKTKENKKASIWDSIFFSATNIASGAKTLGDFVSAPSDFLAVGRFHYLVIIERFLGMLLFALFLTSLARTVIR